MADTIYNFDDFFKIEEIRKQCRVWHEEDDDELKFFAVAAIEHCADTLNRTILKPGSTTSADSICCDDWPIVFNSRIKAAALLMISNLYENRESQTSYNTYSNPTFDLLLSPMKDLQVRFK